MPFVSMPARALAQTIAQKQRTSTIFDDAAPVRRPSACGTDQQTQHFVRNLRTHTRRSPSVSRSTSSLASQQRGNAQRNYMKETSSSRRRSKNAGHEDYGLGGEHTNQTPAPSNCFPSSSRLRSQSPCPTAIPPAPSAALHAPSRGTAVRQGPPLPPSRAPSISRDLQLQQPPSAVSNGGLSHHGGSFGGSSNYSWQLESGHRSFLPKPPQQQKVQQQQEHQKMQGSLNSSWTVRDPLTSAGNAHADLVDADDGSLQLDASDQRELLQLTASFERTGLLSCYRETSSQTNTVSVSCAGSSAVPLRGSTESLSHFSGIPKGPTHCLTTVESPQPLTFTDQSVGRHQQQSEPLQQRHHQQQQQHSQQQQVMPRPWSCPSQPQERSTGGTLTRDAEKLGGIISPPESDKRPGVARSDFGETEAPSRCMAYSEALRQLVGTVKFCLRFVVVLIVCLFRLLNTSYDSWSSAHFKKVFEKTFTGAAYRTGNADCSRLQSALGRISAGSTDHRQQQQPQQQPQQQQPSLPSYSRRNSVIARSTLGSVQQCEPRTGRDTQNRGFDFVSTCKKTDLEALAFHRPVLKVLSLAVVIASFLCWLFITTEPKEEFIDFDFM